MKHNEHHPHPQMQQQEQQKYMISNRHWVNVMIQSRHLLMLGKHLKDAADSPGEKDNCCINKNLQWSLICEQTHFFRIPPLSGFQTPKHFALKIGPVPRSAPLGQTGWYTLLSSRRIAVNYTSRKPNNLWLNGWHNTEELPYEARILDYLHL